MIRGIFYLALIGAFVWFGATVSLGERTLFGHISRIWKAEETQALVEGISEKSAPLVDKVTRGMRAGWREVTRDEESAGRDAGTPSPTSAASSDAQTAEAPPRGASSATRPPAAAVPGAR